MANTTANTAYTIRTDLWSKTIREVLQEELMGKELVNFITDFPDGDEIHIPTLTSLTVRDYIENAEIAIDDPTVGEFTLTIDKYYQVGVAVTDKLKQDTYYLEILNSKFPQQCIRAIMERLESDIMLLHKKQTTNDANTINGAAHRFLVTGNTNTTPTALDIYKAKLALDTANVSKAGRIAIVSPKFAYNMLQLDEVTLQTEYGPNTAIKEGFGATRSIGRFAGFDFYESTMLDEATALDHAAGGALTANLFLGPEAFIGAMRLEPKIEQFRDSPRLRDVYHVTTRYGLGLYRAESLVCMLSTS